MGNQKLNFNMFLNIIFSFTLVEAINAVTVKEQFPQWQNLECERGHRYLFSEDERVWDDALAECTLYGGWLANIGSIWEQNCILRYGKLQNLHAWFWTGAHSPDQTGVFVDEHTGADIEWFSPRWSGGEEVMADGLITTKIVQENLYVKD